MRDQINSLVVGRDKILEAARATDVSIIQSRKQSNLYTAAADVIPSNQIFTHVSRTSMADMMENVWYVIKEIPSLSEYHVSMSIDNKSYIGSLEFFQDLAEASIEDAKKKKSSLKALNCLPTKQSINASRMVEQSQRTTVFQYASIVIKDFWIFYQRTSQSSNTMNKKKKEHFKIAGALTEFKAGV